MTAKTRPGLATYVGLFCALGMPLVLLSLRLLLGQRLHGPLWLGEAIFWGLAAGVLAILVFWERLPLSTIGLGRPGWQSLWWGLGGAAAMRLFIVAVLFAGARISGASFAHDIAIAENLGSLPLAVVVLLALRAGVVEEILFRGYGIERLSAVTGSRALAAVVSLAIFVVAHLGSWDVNYVLVVLPAGLVLTLLYLWRRDLWANMLAHFVNDALSLAAAYALAHHLTRL